MKNELTGAGVDRRSFLKRTAAVGVAAPVVATFVMPHEAQASSGDAAPVITSAACAAVGNVVLVQGTGIAGATVNVYTGAGCGGTPVTTASVLPDNSWTASYSYNGDPQVSANQDTTGGGTDPGACATSGIDVTNCA